MNAGERVELLPVQVPAFVVYLAGFQQIHQLSQGLDSLAFYRDYPNAFAEFSCWSSDSDIEDVYTPLPSIEIDFPPELLGPRDDPDPMIRALKQRFEAVKGKPQPLHGGALELGLLLPAYRVNGNARLLVVVREHWNRPARFGPRR